MSTPSASAALSLRQIMSVRSLSRRCRSAASGINFVTMRPPTTSFAHFDAGSESAQAGIGSFFTFSHLAQTGLRNFMAPVTERCAFTTRLRLTGVRPNSLANRTALS